jgi:hypothetical protein
LGPNRGARWGAGTARKDPGRAVGMREQGVESRRPRNRFELLAAHEGTRPRAPAPRRPTPRVGSRWRCTAGCCRSMRPQTCSPTPARWWSRCRAPQRTPRRGAPEGPVARARRGRARKGSGASARRSQGGGRGASGRRPMFCERNHHGARGHAIAGRLRVGRRDARPVALAARARTRKVMLTGADVAEPWMAVETVTLTVQNLLTGGGGRGWMGEV